MADVRLTATNPEDSSVVPVACDAAGRLLLEEQQVIEGPSGPQGEQGPPGKDGQDGQDGDPFSGNFAGNVTFGGRAWFAEDVIINGVTVGLGGSSEATNTAVGNVVLEDITTGRENTAVGRAALQLTTEGSFNCAFGNFALQRNTEGERNTSVGRTALHLNVSGDANTAVGQNALTSNTAGNYNTVVGQNAGYHIQGNNNTILGSYEGTAADASLSDTVLISAGREWRMVSDATGVTEFSADVVVGSRSKKWMLVEQNGLCHMVEQVRATTADLVEPPERGEVEYPQLRDVFAELDVVERALEEVMVKLRMAQPSGWPVWDGSDEISE